MVLAACAALVSLLTRGATAAAAPPDFHAEPAVIFTRAWASSGDANPPPVWLMVPMLLDIQPTLMRVDVRRDVAGQLRRFCHSHVIAIAKCAVLFDALNEFVDFEHLCSPQKEKQSEPSFMIVKNIIVTAPSGDNTKGKASTFTWEQDDARSIAADLCRFAQSEDGAKTIVKLDDSCVFALEAALLRSLNWINSLESCDLITKQRAGVEQAPARDEREEPDLITRVASIELSIAALKTKSEEKDTSLEKESSYNAVSGEELERGDQSDLEQLAGVADMSASVPLVERDAEPSSSKKIPESCGEDRRRSSTVEATPHQPTSTSPATESNAHSVYAFGEDLSSEEAAFENQVTKDILPSATTAATPSLDMEEPKVDSSTNDEPHTDKLLSADINAESKLSTSDDDGLGDQHHAHVPVGQARDLTEADDLKGPGNDGEQPTLRENGPINAEPIATADEISSTPVGDLSASTEETSSIEVSSPTNKVAEESVERMRSPIAVEAIGMVPETNDEAPAPTPELLEVLSTLAMLCSVVYLVLDLLSITISNFIDTLQARGSQAAQVLAPLFSRSESKSLIAREREVAPLPEHNDTKESLSRASRRPSPRTWSTLFFASSALRETRNAFQCRAYALEKVAKSYLRRLQKAAFGFWRFGTILIGPNVALVRNESSENLSSTSIHAVHSHVSELVGTSPKRTSFTCVAMALMFARHGAIFHSIDPSKLVEDSKATRSKLEPAQSRSLLFDYRRDAAARRIQASWRSKYKKARNVKLSINTDSLSASSFHGVSTSAPPTPLFALLAKDLRKRQPQSKASGTPRLAFTICKVMTPSSSARLPPAS